MTPEKRKGPRRQLRYTAWISLGPKNLHGCVVADISDFGARLDVENADDLPGHFVLFLSARGKPKRKCRIVWRDANRIGIEFDRPLDREEKNRSILKAERMTPPAPAPVDNAELACAEPAKAAAEL